MSPIPVQNLYYLLSYAWELVDEGGPAPVSFDDTCSAPDMLALMLAAAIESLGKRELYRDYQPRIEETSRLRGRIDFVSSVRRLTHLQARLVCHFDELGADNLMNGILRATVDRLLTSATIDSKIRARLQNVAPVLQGIPAVPLNPGCFRRVRVTRHHRSYRLALAVCELLYELALPDTNGKTHNFIDPWQGRNMPKTFEVFVRNFLRRNLAHATVTAKQLAWDAKGDTAEAQALLPKMKTDIAVEWGTNCCLVIDCKFYQNSFTYSFDKVRLISDHLYQIAAYLHHHPMGANGGKIYGCLLYPTVNDDFFHQYDFMGHRLTVATVDLGQRWQDIHERLLEIADVAVMAPSNGVDTTSSGHVFS